MVKVLFFRCQQCFGSFTMLLVEGSSRMRLFTHFSKHVFWGPEVQNTSAMKVIFFLKMFKIESIFTKCKRKIKKRFFVSEIIASENVATNFLY